MSARDPQPSDAGLIRQGAEAGGVSFQSLLEPVTLEKFFGDVSGRRPLHVSGNPRKFADLFSWAEFNRLLDMSKLWSDRSMKLVLDGRDVPPASYSVNGMTREGTRALLPDSPKVKALLRRGATMILDLVETLTPGIAAVSRALTAATGSVVVCNAYCSFKSHQGFLAHFDTTDVFALHIEGSKVWRIYEGVADHPVDIPGYNSSSLTPEEHSSARGSLAMEVEMTPGDLIYLPRGQYHEALASSESSLHLSFGANRATGLDFVSLLSRWLADDPRFRRSLPHFDDVDAQRRHLIALGEALRGWAQSAEVAAKVLEWQRGRAFREGIHQFELPRVEENRRYHVCRHGVRLEKSPQGVVLVTPSASTALSESETVVLETLRLQDFIDQASIESMWPAAESAGSEQFVQKLLEAGAIKPV
ncbi:MAG TPA: cupin domain-containing protein [Gammaproteobacteria bacterium]|nr:cupin domain-containing protein [Gammaproteobacteria bacterium]